MLPSIRRSVTLLTAVASLASLTGLGVAGCSHAQSPRGIRSAALIKSAQAFNDGLRWQHFQKCDRLVAPEIAGAFHAQIVDVSETLQITDGELVGVDWPEDSEAATVRVKLRWVQLPSIIVQTATIEQRWEDRTNRGWTLARMEVKGGSGQGPFDVL